MSTYGNEFENLLKFLNDITEKIKILQVIVSLLSLVKKLFK